MLAIRGKPKALFLTDLSAIVTAWLIALTFPPIVPWWLTVTGTLLAVVVVKQLYGGLGQNPFNPAMAASALMIVAYPALMSQWPAAGQLDFSTQLQLIFGGARQPTPSPAPPLDACAPRCAARQPRLPAPRPARRPADGRPGLRLLGGKGGEWVALGYLVGGLWLLQRRIITWHIPAAFAAPSSPAAGLLWACAPKASPRRCSTWPPAAPCSAPLHPHRPRPAHHRARQAAVRGRRRRPHLRHPGFGAYPDGVAFATLLMNILVP
jgi:electron transport complex protein RnfD